MSSASVLPTIDSSPRVVSSLRASIKLVNSTSSPGRTAAIIAVVTLVSTGVRLYHLAGRSLWMDEAASVYLATMPWWPFLRLLWGYQGNMTLYYLALRTWIHFGDSEFVVRSLSVLFGILTIPAIYALGRRLFDRTTGLIAAALLSVHSFHVAFSQEARGYSLLVLLLLLTTYVFIAAMESNQKQWKWILFAVAAALCVYTHIFAVLVLAAHALAIVFPRPFRVRLSTLALTASVFGSFVAPMAAFVLLHHSDQINWIPRPALDEFFVFLQLLTGQGGVVLAGAYLTLCGLAFWRSYGVAGSDQEQWALRLLGLWLVLPPTLTLAATVIKPLFFPRYMLMCVPALVILAARGIIRLGCLQTGKYWAATAAFTFVLIITLSAWGTHQYFVNFSMETSDWRSAVSYILEHQQPGDGIIFYIPNTYPYRYYAHRAATQHGVAAAPDILYPPVLWRPLSRIEMERDISGRKRVWLVLHFESLDPEKSGLIQSSLEEANLHLQYKKIFPGQDLITVELFRGAATAP